MASYTILEKHAGSRASIPGVMHGNSAHENSPFMSMLSKDDASHQRVMNEYLTHWETDRKDAEDTDEARTKREYQYMSLVNKYVLYPMYSPLPLPPVPDPPCVFSSLIPPAATTTS